MYTAIADALESGLPADPEFGGGFAGLGTEGDEDQHLFELAWDALEQVEELSRVDLVLEERALVALAEQIKGNTIASGKLLAWGASTCPA